MNFQERYKKIIDKLRGWAFSATTIDDALLYGNLYGVIQSINNNGVYSDDVLEEHIKSRVLAEASVDIDAIREARGEGVLILATELYDYGGHTKVVLTWLNLMKDVLPHRLVVTRAATKNVVDKVRGMGGEIVKIAHDGLEGIFSILSEAKGCNRIVMHTHPEDILSAVVVRILSEAGYEIIFYNHADHLFSYGLSAADVVCEISDFGEAINKRTNRVKGQSLRLGIPLKVDKTSLELFVPIKFTKKEKLVVTAGNSYKYKPDNSFLFADFIDELLIKRADIKVAIVGPTGKERWWSSRRKSWGDKVLFMGVLSHDRYMELLSNADLYIDSYPITGGTAFPEALLAGKACLGLISPMQGYSLADDLKVDSVANLIKHTEMILDNHPDAISRQQKTRDMVANFQNEEKFKERICEIYNHKANRIRESYETFLNSFYLEERWLNGGVCNLPKRMLLYKLPFYRSVRIILSTLWVNFLSRYSQLP